MDDEIYPMAADEPMTFRQLRRKVKRSTLLLVVGVILLAAAMCSATSYWAGEAGAARDRALNRQLQAELNARAQARDQDQAAVVAELRAQRADICAIAAVVQSDAIAPVRRRCHEPDPMPSTSPPARPGSPPASTAPAPIVSGTPRGPPVPSPAPGPPVPRPSGTPLVCVPLLHICL